MAETQEMKPGRELDALVAEAMGKCWHDAELIEDDFYKDGGPSRKCRKCGETRYSELDFG